MAPSPLASSELRKNSDLLSDCQAALNRACDAAAKQRAEEERKRREDELADLSSQLRELDYESRALLLALVRNCDVLCEQDDWNEDYFAYDMLFFSLVSWDFCSEDLIRFTAELDLFVLRDCDPEVFGEKTKKLLADRKWRESVDRWTDGYSLESAVRFSFAWWWEPKDEQQKKKHAERVEAQNRKMVELLGSALES